MKKIMLFVALAAICSSMFVSSAEAAGKGHKKHKHHHKHHHAKHHKHKKA